MKKRKKHAEQPRQSSSKKAAMKRLEFRVQHDAGDFVVGGEDRGGVSIVKQADPLRIDKLLTAGVIDETQHLHGLQIITLWMIANRPFIGAMNYGSVRAAMTAIESLNITRMSAADQFYKTMSFLRKREHSLIYMICFEEMGAIEAARRARIKRDDATVYVRHAFDALGDALSAMRRVKKALSPSGHDS